MDPVSHAFVGRLLVGNRSERGIGVAGALGALSPDLDCVLMPVGWDLYLRVHQLGTHAIVGTVACAALVATVIGFWTPQTRWRALALAAWAGALSHVLLDIVSGATVRLWWPASDAITRFGLVAMAEPLLVAIIAIAGLVFWRWPARRLNAAFTGFTIVLFVLAGKAIGRSEAQRLYASATSGDAVRAQILEAEWGAPSRWIAIDRTNDRVRRWHIDTSHSSIVRDLDLPMATANGVAATSLSSGVVRNFLAAHDFPVAIVSGPERAPEIRWSDLQYCRAADTKHLPGSPVDAAGHPMTCALWVSIGLDSRGSIAHQFVTIGNWVQAR